MVNFIASVTLLLTAASATVAAVPSGFEKRAVTCRDDRPASELANVCPAPLQCLLNTDSS